MLKASLFLPPDPSASRRAFPVRRSRRAQRLNVLTRTTCLGGQHATPLLGLHQTHAVILDPGQCFGSWCDQDTILPHAHRCLRSKAQEFRLSIS